MKSLGAIAGGFALFKGLQKVGGMFFSSLMYQSKEFRSAWTDLNNQLIHTFGAMAQKWGPSLARMVESLTIKLINLIEGLDAAFDPEAWDQLGKQFKDAPKAVSIKKSIQKQVFETSANPSLDPTDSFNFIGDYIHNLLRHGLGMPTDSSPQPVVIVDGGPA